MPSEIKIEKFEFAAAGVNIGNFQGLLETSIRISNNAKSFAPKDTRRLSNSIMYQVSGKGAYYEGGFNDGGGEKANSDEALTTNPRGESKPTAYVGTNLEYAVYQEYGTRHQTGRAYMRPAVQSVLSPGNAVAIGKAWEKAMAEAFAQKRIITERTVAP